ncbi:hypothetical protein [Prochlorococcus sp. MIT 1303]|uniref:hypothetical protein n=1 Tax=Prochlorococcus sp. MIT 1303 TaxID=1723647 RepID=UPI0007BB48A0|nr:hypothetical protein [Prochlorococcus sp. MIT 1303]KZR67189.1 hypothetical protein PMIT1303_00666 [Prochlorococcus sp. MIT 1303]
MAYSVNNINDLIPWGLNPTWIGNQLNHTWHVGTHTVSHHNHYNHWAHHHNSDTTSQENTYEDNIKYEANHTFNKDMWNTYAAGTKGIRGNQVRENGGYGLNANIDGAITLNQDVGSVVLGKPTGQIKANGGQSMASSSANTVRNTSSSPITTTLKVTKTTSDSSQSSTTSGYTQGHTLDIGTSLKQTIKAGVEGIASTETEIGLNINNTLSTEINSSSTTETSNSTSITFERATSVTVDPGKAVNVFLTWDTQKINVPWTSPIHAEGSSTYWDKYENRINYKVGDAMGIAKKFGVPDSHLIKGTTGNVTDFVASGMIHNVHNYDFNVSARDIVQNNTATSLKGSSLDKNIDHTKLSINSHEAHSASTVYLDGVLTHIGREYRANDHTENGKIMKGTDKGDLIELGGKNQVAYTFGGNDYVLGSVHADRIYSQGNGIGGNEILSGDGDDYIESYDGSEYIDAGNGNDTVIVGGESGKLDDITLGNGRDSLEIKLDNNIDGVAFIIRDASLEDSIKIHGSNRELHIKAFGDTVEVHAGDDQIGLLHNYASYFDFAGNELLNVGVMNKTKLSSGKLNNENLEGWWDEIVVSSIKGNDIITDYNQFISDEAYFKDNIRRSLYHFLGGDLSPTEEIRIGNVATTAYSLRDNYNDVSNLLMASLEKDNVSIGYFNDPLA